MLKDTVGAELFAGLSALDLARLAAWAMLAEGRWQEAAQACARMAPYHHRRLPTETHASTDPDPETPPDPVIPPPPPAGLTDRTEPTRAPTPGREGPDPAPIPDPDPLAADTTETIKARFRDYRRRRLAWDRHHPTRSTRRFDPPLRLRFDRSAIRAEPVDYEGLVYGRRYDLDRDPMFQRPRERAPP